MIWREAFPWEAVCISAGNSQLVLSALVCHSTLTFAMTVSSDQMSVFCPHWDVGIGFSMYSWKFLKNLCGEGESYFNFWRRGLWRSSGVLESAHYFLAGCPFCDCTRSLSGRSPDGILHGNRVTLDVIRFLWKSEFCQGKGTNIYWFIYMCYFMLHIL